VSSKKGGGGTNNLERGEYKKQANKEDLTAWGESKGGMWFLSEILFGGPRPGRVAGTKGYPGKNWGRGENRLNGGKEGNWKGKKDPQGQKLLQRLKVEADKRKGGGGKIIGRGEVLFWE